MKNRIQVIVIIILSLALAGCIGFGIWYNNSYYTRTTQEVAELRGMYEDTVMKCNEYATKYEKQSKENEELKAKINGLEIDLNTSNENLENCESLLKQINEERQLQIDEYNSWYNSLSDELKSIIDARELTNKMVNDLLANNSEYAGYYIKMNEYGQKKSRSIKESKEVVALNEKMKTIENEWLEAHKE